MLDVLSPLITEADFVSNELLDIILVNIVEPQKTQRKNAFMLAKELIMKTSATLEAYIQAFFNQVGNKNQRTDSPCCKDLARRVLARVARSTKEGLEAPGKSLLQMDYAAPEAPYHPPRFKGRRSLNHGYFLSGSDKRWIPT